jgi:hypothetical protein
VRWPNVTLKQLPKFEDHLATWFKRPVPVWITEYGYQTRPAKAGGVTSAQQAAYLRQAVDVAAGDPNVQMFIWFILRDDPTSDWKSGLVARNGAKKPSFATFTKRAAAYDGRGPEITLEPGQQYPLVRFGALELWSRSGTGAKVGLTVTLYSQAANRLRLVRTAQPLARIGYDGWISFRVPLKRAIARVYTVDVRAVDIHGNRIDRSLVLRVKPRH